MLRRATKTALPTPTATVTPAGPADILVVNDDEGACELLVRVLDRAGHHVQRAHNAEQALGQLSVGRTDCVVLDLATGGIGQNLKLIDAIRSSVTESITDVRVVLVAPQARNSIIWWQTGVDALLVRPFHANELLSQVNEVLSRPDTARERHRREQLDAVSAEGRPGDAQPRTSDDQA